MVVMVMVVAPVVVVAVDVVEVVEVATPASFRHTFWTVSVWDLKNIPHCFSFLFRVCRCRGI